MNYNMSEEKVLLKIYRQFSEKEGFRFMFDIIKKLRFQIGELKSEVAELEYNCKNYEADKKLREDYEKLREENRKLRKSMIEYRDKYYQLLSKQKLGHQSKLEFKSLINK